MTVLAITRGLPGSGKSTWAAEWVQEDPDHRAEVNRDHIRLMLGRYEVGTPAQEKMVTTVSHNTIRDLLRSGVSVVVSDTNLPMKYVRELTRIGHAEAAEILVHDLTNVSLDECLRRNRLRQDKTPVPDMVIRRMYFKHVSGKPYPLPMPEGDSAGKAPDFWVPDLDLLQQDEHDIFDVDGTLAASEGVRSPYDYTKVSLDRPRKRVIDIARSRYYTGHGILVVSGRPDIHDGQVRRDTETWLTRYLDLPFTLFMRPADMQDINDAIVKRHLFDKHIRHVYNLTGVVFDDRDRVVRMWREQLGLDVMQVNYGSF